MPLLRRRRPVLRAAVAGGAAYHMGKRAARSGEQPQQEAAAPSGPTAAQGMSPTDMGRLKELAELHDQGVLTDEEFEQQKRLCLSGGR